MQWLVDGSDEIELDPMAAMAAVDSVVGKTIDPVRMYMREMGTVPLLSREGEIKIAKRIEAGLLETMGVLVRYPGTVQYVINEYDRIIAEEGNLSVMIAGYLDSEDTIPDMSSVAHGQSPVATTNRMRKKLNGVSTRKKLLIDSKP